MSDDTNVREQIAYYEREARKFDTSVWSLGRRDNRNHLVKINAISRAIGAAEGGRVLEVGTGTGLHARWLLENTPADYTGIDISVPMLRLAFERVKEDEKRFRAGIGDAHNLPFPDGGFDAAFCSGTLHHLSDPARGVRELVRVTKPGGRVAAMEPNWKFPSVLLVTALNKAERNCFRINGPRLAGWAVAAGLEDVKLYRMLYTPPVPDRWARTYDKMDRMLNRTPGLRYLSIMLLVTGRKRD